jgi:hypothetical protein
VFPLAYGWFAAVVRNGQLIALAHENGLRHECAASARLVLQHTLALQRLIEGDPAVGAVEADGYRRAFDLVRELADTGWPLPDGFTLQPGARPAQSGALEEQFGNFKAICVLYTGRATRIPATSAPWPTSFPKPASCRPPPSPTNPSTQSTPPAVSSWPGTPSRRC